MDCKFFVIPKDKETYESLKPKADAYTNALLLFLAKCSFFEYLEKMNVEIQIIPYTSLGDEDCFYNDKGKITDCNEENQKKFILEMKNLNWKDLTLDESETAF